MAIKVSLPLFERHFNERPYLEHACYLFLTKTTKERISQQSNFTTLCRGFIIPKEIRDPEAISRFLDAVGQAESIIRESGLIGIRRLTTEEILGDEKDSGNPEPVFHAQLRTIGKRGYKARSGANDDRGQDPLHAYAHRFG